MRFSTGKCKVLSGEARVLVGWPKTQRAEEDGRNRIHNIQLRKGTWLKIWGKGNQQAPFCLWKRRKHECEKKP